MLDEFRKLGQENNESFYDLKASLTRLESTMDKLKQRTKCLDKRLTETEERVSVTEDRHIRHKRVLSYLLCSKANLAVKCDNIENRLAK